MSTPTKFWIHTLIRWSLIIVLVIVACERVNDAPCPILYTGEIVNISDKGAIFTGVFKNIDPDQIADYGFIWEMGKAPTVESSTKYSLPLPFKNNSHSYNNNSSLSKDTTYYMRIFVTYDDKETYYGKAVPFYSLGSQAPVINNIEPSTACFGDTITIQGNYFGLDSTDINVIFGGIDQANIIHTADTSIKVLVPFFTSGNSYFSSDLVTIKVQRSGFFSAKNTQFQLSPPRITSYTPNEGNSYTEMTISGYGFHPKFTEVTIGEHKCDIKLINCQNMQVLLPAIFQDYQDFLKIKVAKKTTTLGLVKVLGMVIDKIFPDTVFSYEKLKLYGHNLDTKYIAIYLNNEQARILNATYDSITVEVPGEICTNELKLKMRSGGNSQVYDKKIMFRQPKIIDIQRAENNYFDGNFTIKGQYFPDIGQFEQISINGIVGNYTYNFNKSISSINIDVPWNVEPVDEWLNAKIKFCQSTQKTVDSVFRIPKPEILEVSDKVYPFQRHTITGKNFNMDDVDCLLTKVNLGNTHLEHTYLFQENKLAFWPPENLASGTYPLKVTVNGQESDPVDVELINRWNMLGIRPETLGLNSIFFLHENNLYVGGGKYNVEGENISKDFKSFDLLSHEWNNKSSLPLQYGLGFTDSSFGYAYGEGKLFKYDFNSDSWSLLSQKDIDYTTGFLYDDKIFIFSIDISQVHYYYDLEENIWVQFAGYSGTVSSPRYMQSVLCNDVAYLFQEDDIFKIDLTDLSISDTNETQNPYDYKSSMGFEYNGDLYLYKENGFEIRDTNNFGTRYIGGPSGYIPNIIRDGTTVYFLNYTNIWTFDLTSQ